MIFFLSEISNNTALAKIEAKSYRCNTECINFFKKNNYKNN